MRPRRWPILVIFLTLPVLARAQGSTTQRPGGGDGDTPTGEGWSALKVEYVAGVGPRCPWIRPIAGHELGFELMDDKIELPTDPRITYTTSPSKGAFPSIKVDTDGDGKPDAKSKRGRATVDCVLKYDDGTKQPYQFILDHYVLGKETYWNRRWSCYRMTAYKGVKITLIDDDNDGRWNGYGDGKDMVVIGSSKYAHYLSRVLRIGPRLFELHVNTAGTKAWVRPWTGETGKIDVITKYDAQGSAQLCAAVIVGKGGTSFNVVGSRDAAIVPAGKYALVWGYVKAGRESAHALYREDGDRPRLETDGEPHAWGGAIRLGFRLAREGRKFTMDQVGSVTLTGTGGELYEYLLPVPPPRGPALSWSPPRPGDLPPLPRVFAALWPRIRVRDAESNKLLTSSLEEGWTGSSVMGTGDDGITRPTTDVKLLAGREERPVQVQLYTRRFKKLFGTVESAWVDK